MDSSPIDSRRTDARARAADSVGAGACEPLGSISMGRACFGWNFRMSPVRLGASAHEQALALSMAFYGRSATLLPTAWTYGPSPRHAIDRQQSTNPAESPFLRTYRMAPPDDLDNPTSAAPHHITIEVFRATPDGRDGAQSSRPPRARCGCRLPRSARLIRGAAVAEALSLDGVEARLADGVTLPSDGFIFLPADVGERMLSRIGAKYGEGALFANPAARA